MVLLRIFGIDDWLRYPSKAQREGGRKEGKRRKKRIERDGGRIRGEGGDEEGNEKNEKSR